jgi:hypothetical protein
LHNFSRPWERARGIGCAQGAAHSTCANLIVDDGQAQPCCRRACLWLTAAVVVIVSHFSLIRQTLSIRSSKRPASKPTKGGSNLMPSGDCAATVPRPELEYEVPIATRLFLGWFLGCPRVHSQTHWRSRSISCRDPLDPVCSRGHLLDRVLQDSFLDHVAVRVLNPGLVAESSPSNGGMGSQLWIA